MDEKPVVVYILPANDRDAITRFRNRIEKNGKGKPFAVNGIFPFVSISHSGDYFAAAFSDCNVGFDLQFWQRRPGENIKSAVKRYGSLAEKFFHQEESAYIMAEGSCCLERFFRVWTAKESYVKYTGRGIDDDFSRFSVIGQGIDRGQWEARGVHFIAERIFDSYSFCTCLEREKNLEFKLFKEGEV